MLYYTNMVRILFYIMLYHIISLLDLYELMESNPFDLFKLNLREEPMTRRHQNGTGHPDT